MKVLHIHNFYQSSSPSGEDAVYRNEAAMLKDNGLEVIQYEKHNDDISGAFKKIKTAFNMAWSKETYGELRKLIKKEKPDIAHFHNIWYLISPSAYYACKDANVPVVQTLHNFRMFCANGLLLRDGKTCESCIGKTPWRSVAYRCFRNSRLYSLPVAISEKVHQTRGTWVNAIDAYIALTEFGRKKFIECGLPENKIFVKPNFLPDPPIFSSSSQDYAVFIGRLSEEKGIDVLIEAFQILASSHPLNFKIVGDGPMKDEIMGRWEDMKMGQSKDGKAQDAKGEGLRAEGIDIEFAGRKNHDECREVLSNARFLIMPSVCYENFPMAIVEAFACGKPVVASRLGAMAAIVENNKTGLLFEPGNAEELANAIKRLWEDEALCREMGKNARAEFEEKYMADTNYKILMNIYDSVLDENKGK